MKDTEYYKSYRDNHDLLSKIEVGFYVSKDDPKNKRFIHKVQDTEMQLSEIFKSSNNYETILHSFTCANARRGYNYERLEFFGDAIIALLSRFETVLFNLDYNENELDMERLDNESNKRFKIINIKNEFYKYMIAGSAEIKNFNKKTGKIETKTIDSMFVPPLIDTYHYNEMMSIKKNEMKNKYFQMKLIRNEISRYDKSCLFTSSNNNLSTLLEF